MEYLKFSNGDEMPIVGLGTWRAPDLEVETALNTALEVGYRHIDCAPVYMNEKVIGKVFNEWISSGRIQRKDLFVTTKLPPYGNRAEDVEKCLKQSLADLQLDYFDLYLIHVPFAVPYTEGPLGKHENGDIILSDTDHVKTWKELEKFKSQGLIKHIGISNFNEKQIQRLIDNSVVKPECLQVEVHVYLQQAELLKYCKDNNILVVAYSSLGSRGIEKLLGHKVPDLIDNEVVVDIANKLSRTPAQVLLRYCISVLGVGVIPKSTNADRLKANLKLFDFSLGENDVKRLKDLNANIRINDFGFFQGIEKHPEFPFTK